MKGEHKDWYKFLSPARALCTGIVASAHADEPDADAMSKMAEVVMEKLDELYEMLSKWDLEWLDALGYDFGTGLFRPSNAKTKRTTKSRR